MSVEAEKLEHMLRDIQRDNLSGSVKMAGKAATLARQAAVHAQTSGGDLGTTVASWLQRAAQAHPFMALVRTVARQAAEATSVEDLGHRMDRLMWELENSNQRIGECALSLFTGGGVFMTNSFSSTVYTALKHMAESGGEVRTIVVESRPAREGVQLARALGEHDIRSTLIVDAGIASFMDRVDAVLVGGDTVSGSFFVNKLGTHPLVLTGQSQGVPVYLLASLQKLVPDDEVPSTEEPHSPEEVEKGQLANVTVENYYFERVPLKLVTGVVTEEGVLTPDQIGQRVRSLN